ncbi:MAG: 5-formaminoimidazole-4-carboxamide-1-(beta)-D-ribofuranosyl 5'-monophosphate synthetase-like protein, 5-formaminoimidazole-4-carboxamide-1-(beta)-D-ribofuranosyl 5'-monophosphate synthetase [Candidatus Peregrinibacteria bacterium GW2011_GWF2_39_17]|nr:MAG: 5-formaminoimidazole-4-carboxamide-1-(beta)-D-ribofuranosyl 5'-monophosphate synthetase-like protein, 5-formaminoimidazole-4-carboxamide-1-(beta)-D-ribofuranosyl 5'-monophosphate synthetase [Candidatus Peregrinibacteria bacterium GW2011_GWF2_39_17]HCW32606.1 5-formaminoimidazole-4-carboxamide-1-(beta)-D-ribofuranosyl 5'-monophosphate synthetase [Candidatus Peregrinibacteria bacterium]
MDITSILTTYNLKNLTIASLGGHSALDVCHGAKKYGFQTLVVAKKGREKTYTDYYKTREDGRGCIDEVILMDQFDDVLKPEIQEELRKRNAIFIQNRYFWVYFKDFSRVENEFKVPIFGLRQGVKLEERDQPLNQYHLLQKAGIRMPKLFASQDQIDRLVLVKVNEAERSYERAFFFAHNKESFESESAKKISSGQIRKEDLDKATIEEYIIGAHLNLNFFYSVLNNELELMGTDTRRQTDLDGFLRLPFNEQRALHRMGFKPKMIETGHYAVTMKESLLEKAYEIGEKFVKTMKQEVAPGIIGPFALQGAVAADEGKEEFVIFDVSMRIPGSPGTRFTPYSGYLHGESLSYGERIALELRQAVETGKIVELIT